MSAVARSDIHNAVSRLLKLDVNFHIPIEQAEAKNLDADELEDLVRDISQDITKGLKSLIHHQILYLMLTFASPEQEMYCQNKDFMRLIQQVMMDIGGDLMLLMGMVGNSFAKESSSFQHHLISSLEWNWTISRQNMIWYRSPNETQIARDTWNQTRVVDKVKLFNGLPLDMFRKLSQAIYRCLAITKSSTLAPVLALITRTFSLIESITGVSTEVVFSPYPLRPGYAETAYDHTSAKLKIEL